MRSAKLAFLIGFILFSASCHTMRPTTLEFVGAVHPAEVWVTRADHSVIEVFGPRLIENKLYGWFDGRVQSIPSDDVQQLVIRSVAGVRTAALVGVGALGIVSIAAVLSSTGDYRNPCSLSSSDECDFGREPSPN